MKPGYIDTYIGFCGQIHDATQSLSTLYLRPGAQETPFYEKNGGIQWVSPSFDQEVNLFSPTPDGHFFFSGLLWNEHHSLSSFAQNILSILKSTHFEHLAPIVEKSVGCYIDMANTLYLWVGFAASNETIFYRIEDAHVRWSTRPLDLVYSSTEIDPWALRRCCHGDDIFIYPQLQRVEQGHLVTISPDRRVVDYQFDTFQPSPVMTAKKMSLEGCAQATREALRNAVQPLAAEGPVGIMLSGGVGSAALLAIMKEVGIYVIAYHLEPADPAGSEYHFAQSACQALHIPLRRIRMDTGPDYLPTHWFFSHPYSHNWMRWYMQVAQKARQDGVHVLVTGGGDDSSFGPEHEYNMHAILRANISWKEKKNMILGMLFTDWNIFDILRSAWPWPTRQLIGLSSVAGPAKRDQEMRKADFLVSLPPHSRERDDAALIHAPRFAAQSIMIGHALQQNGIHLYYPYHDRNVQSISLGLPSPYRLIAHMNHFSGFTDVPDQIINKPILRIALRNALPPEVLWRTWPTYTQAPVQTFCLNHPEIFKKLLGTNSHLARHGISDPSRLEQVFSHRERIRDNYQTLVASAMVEIFLQNAQQQWERGGPLWA